MPFHKFSVLCLVLVKAAPARRQELGLDLALLLFFVFFFPLYFTNHALRLKLLALKFFLEGTSPIISVILFAGEVDKIVLFFVAILGIFKISRMAYLKFSFTF